MHGNSCVREGMWESMRKDMCVCVREDVQQMGMWVGMSMSMHEGGMKNTHQFVYSSPSESSSLLLHTYSSELGDELTAGRCL